MRKEPSRRAAKEKKAKEEQAAFREAMEKAKETADMTEVNEALETGTLKAGESVKARVESLTIDDNGKEGSKAYMLEIAERVDEILAKEQKNSTTAESGVKYMITHKTFSTEEIKENIETVKHMEPLFLFLEINLTWEMTKQKRLMLFLTVGETMCTRKNLAT